MKYIVGAVIIALVGFGVSSVVFTSGGSQASTAYWTVKSSKAAFYKGASDGKIVVTEFFWYGCPHCFAFEPYLNRWAAHYADIVTLRRVPAVLNERWRVQARIFYTARKLGVLNSLHETIFDTIHERGKRLNTEKKIKRFFGAHGISASRFSRAWTSVAVDDALDRASRMAKRFNVLSVPTIVVAGRYGTGPQLVDSYKQLLQVMTKLVQKTRRAPVARDRRLDSVNSD